MSGLRAAKESSPSPGRSQSTPRVVPAPERTELPDPAAFEQLVECTVAKLFELGGAKLVGQLVELFAGSAPGRIDTIRMADQDPDAAELAAHTLKSSTGNLGAMRMWAQCQVLESLAAAGDFGPLYEQMASDLQREYSIVEPRLRSLMETKR